MPTGTNAMVSGCPRSPCLLRPTPVGICAIPGLERRISVLLSKLLIFRFQKRPRSVFKKLTHANRSQSATPVGKTIFRSTLLPWMNLLSVVGFSRRIVRRYSIVANRNGMRRRSRANEKGPPPYTRFQANAVKNPRDLSGETMHKLFLRRLAVIFLIFFVSGVPFASAQPAKDNGQSAPAKAHTDILRGAYGPFRANNDLLYYHLDIRVDPTQKFISGKNTIRFKMLKDDSRIQLDLV